MSIATLVTGQSTFHYTYPDFIHIIGANAGIGSTSCREEPHNVPWRRKRNHWKGGTVRMKPSNEICPLNVDD